MSKDKVVKCMMPIDVIEEQYCLSFTPDTDKILGVAGRFMYIQLDGHIAVPDADDPDTDALEFNGEYIDKTAILKITINEFQKLFKLWIQGKKEFCERYGHWCGAFGNFHIEEFKVVSFENLTRYDDNKDCDDEDFIYWEEVPVIQVTKWNEHPDFEHG